MLMLYPSLSRMEIQRSIQHLIKLVVPFFSTKNHFISADYVKAIN